MAVKHTVVLVVWTNYTKGSDPVYTDEWQACSDMVEATALYEKLLDTEGTYIANICGVIRSTDYDEQQIEV